MDSNSGDILVIAVKILVSGFLLWRAYVVFKKKENTNERDALVTDADTPTSFLASLGLSFLLGRLFNKIPNWFWSIIVIAFVIWILTL